MTEDKKKRVIEILTADTAAKTLVECAKEFAAESQVSTSQMRSFFAEVKRCELKMRNSTGPALESGRRSLMLLVPKLAYAAKRHGDKFYDFKDLVSFCAISVAKEADDKRFCSMFAKFVDFFEAIVAFAKKS